jgi:hypothetical protein
MFSPAVARSVVALSSLAALAGCQAGEVAVDQPRMSEDEPREEKVDRDQARDRDRDERDERRGDDDAPRMNQPGAGLADGTYQAGGGYQSPNGPETIEVSLTITNGVIEEVSVTPGATSSTSKRYQGDFAGGIAAEVVGKSLDEVDVTRVAGSSLTSGGFQEALATIRQDATVG